MKRLFIVTLGKLDEEVDWLLYARSRLVSQAAVQGESGRGRTRC